MRRPVHIAHGRRHPLVRHEERDLIPIRGGHLLLVAAILPTAIAFAWLATWAICELRK